jgi:DNA polymerase
MTAEEKTFLACFLDLAGDYLRDGHRRNHENSSLSEAPQAERTNLPLAYLVEEPGEQDEENNADDSLEAIAAAVRNCKGCGLSARRTLAVPGEGVTSPMVMVIGEGPGGDEDRAGRPFVGRAGQLLDKMLASIGLFRDKNCFIANMVKCRPPGNRDPAPEEIAACLPYLERQITLLRPNVILAVGRVAAQSLLRTSRGINALRGEFADFELGGFSEDALGGRTVIPVLPSFHPSALLRDESLKRPAWEDLKLLKARIVSLDEDDIAE